MVRKAKACTIIPSSTIANHSVFNPFLAKAFPGQYVYLGLFRQVYNVGPF